MRLVADYTAQRLGGFRIVDMDADGAAVGEVFWAPGQGYEARTPDGAVTVTRATLLHEAVAAHGAVLRGELAGPVVLGGPIQLTRPAQGRLI